MKMVTVNVSTVIFGSNDKERSLPAVRLSLISQRITAQEILIRSVKKQFEALREQHLGQAAIIECIERHYLSASTIRKQSNLGKIALENPSHTQSKTKNLEVEITRVVHAFNEGQFKMFIDNTEITDLNEHCTLKKTSQIKFIRLIPLVGG